ncbi:prepilin-type N-terminal cleavage/methylation domain-containing protein [Pseudomarimonas salicorniae]|uniref:Prepilin-type N-terminal cleavage/methylation domain-containing protein n=1 Tax=Pseudomarimonas salicorniae TaxID=2933270 RepID=A0ABT0GGY4_9GAMM|nr:prepilin-type N-terminal cleavage/methylation domain-containing protein [Lysobacter sp. CAU 1642]MCK7593796.1 prepilin-type N-terminal cleavage/methylation domain-containing protein [Lysobacter sp. CAU 1642]
MPRPPTPPACTDRFLFLDEMTRMPAPDLHTLPPRQRGFSLLELSVVLVVIAVIIGAVSVGGDIQRNANYQRVASQHVQAWAVVFDTYASANNLVLGDSATAPTGKVNGADNTPLCGANLRSAVQAAGIRLPPGRAEGSEDLAVYLDASGTPQEVQVCFSSVDWHEPGATSGTYVVRKRNVMTLSRLSPALARLLDAYFDNHPDASFGRFREQSRAAQTTPTSSTWSQNESAIDEAQSASLSAYLLMNR